MVTIVATPTTGTSNRMSCLGFATLTTRVPGPAISPARIMTAIGILVLLWMYQPWRKTMQNVADCVREDTCEEVGAQ